MDTKPGPGICFATEPESSVDCFVSRRPIFGRGKVDGEKINQTKRTSFGGRIMGNPEAISFSDAQPEFGMSRLDAFNSRHHRHVLNRSPEGLAELWMLQIIVDGNCDLTVRQVASIHFKNFVSKNWSPHDPVEQSKILSGDKYLIRQNILVFVVQVPTLLRGNRSGWSFDI